MKLSKQERIGVLIIAVIIILGLGIFFFIVPKFQELESANKSLKSQQKSLSELEAKVSDEKISGLREDIESAYKDGKDLANMFFEEMDPYQADQEVRAFLEQCKEKDINVVVEDLAVTPKSVTTLSVAFFDEPEISYALKTNATSGQQTSDEELEAAAKRQELMAKLTVTEDVALITVTFDAYTETPEEMIKFIDAINDYQKNENGKNTRKAMRLNSMELDYTKYLTEYEEIMAEINEELEKKTDQELKDQWGADADVEDEEEEQGAPEEKKEEGTMGVAESIFSMPVTITFYSVERMQDPADLLDEQDAQIGIK